MCAHVTSYRPALAAERFSSGDGPTDTPRHSSIRDVEAVTLMDRSDRRKTVYALGANGVRDLERRNPHGPREGEPYVLISRIVTHVRKIMKAKLEIFVILYKEIAVFLVFRNIFQESSVLGAESRDRLP